MQQVQHVFSALNDTRVKHKCSVCYLYDFSGFKTFRKLNKVFNSKCLEMVAMLFYGKMCHNIPAQPKTFSKAFFIANFVNLPRRQFRLLKILSGFSAGRHSKARLV